MLKIWKNKNLKNLNTYKLKVKADYYCEVHNKKQLSEVFDFIKRKNIKYFILGRGANVIFLNDKYDGLIIKIINNRTR